MSGALPSGLTLDPQTGELTGTPTQPGTTGPVTVAHTVGDPYTALAVGNGHACALTTAGAADCWADYFDPSTRTGPFTAVSIGLLHTCALTTGGAADCWGPSPDGRADDQPGPYTGIDAGDRHTCALTPAGAADCWGDDTSGQAVDQAGPYTSVSAGGAHTCALTPAGVADCWGSNASGQAVDQAGPYTAIEAGWAHTCALTPAQAIECWGRNDFGQAAAKPGPYEQVVVGRYHTCARTPGGAAECWGYNTSGQVVDQPGPFTAIGTGGQGTCGLTPDGEADCWGSIDDRSRFLQVTQTFTLTVVGVTSMTPKAGLTSGGTEVTLTGTGFTGVTGVRFGPTPATGFTIVDDTTIVATSPPRPAGLVNVWVDWPSGTNPNTPATHFAYQDPPVTAPTITSVSPNIGDVAGGQQVTIVGSGFLSATSVAFGPTPATSYTILSDARIVATTPARPESLVNVRVTNPNGTNPNQPTSWYSYRTITGPPPTVSAVSPTSGPATGGQTITITGTGFTGTIRVDLGPTTAPAFTVIDDTTIEITTPARPPGLVNVFVRTNNGTNPTGPSSWYRST